MRHYDLDEIKLLEPFIADLSNETGRLLGERFALPQAPAAEIREDRLYMHGDCITRRREFSWRVEAGAAALQVRTLIHRFIHPASGQVDQTLELFVLPESRRAGLVRFLLVAGLPLLGAAIGVLGWYFLQFDTNMVLPPWLVGGLISGLAVGILSLRKMTQPLAACLERKDSPLRAKHRRTLEAEIAGVVERLRDVHLARPAAAAAQTEISAALGDPQALSAYVAAMAGQTDETILRYGLAAEANRRSLQDLFVHVKEDAALHHAFQEALARLAEQPVTASEASSGIESRPE